MKEIQIPISAPLDKLVASLDLAPKVLDKGLGIMESRATAFGDRFSGSMNMAFSKVIDGLTSDFTNKFVGEIDNATGGLGSMLTTFTQLEKAGTKAISSISRKLTHLTKILDPFDDKFSSSMQSGFSNVIESMSQDFTQKFLGEIDNATGGLGSMITAFPQVEKAGTNAISNISRKLTHLAKTPMGLAVLSAGALGVALYKNLDPAAGLISNISNALIKSANKSEIFRKGVSFFTIQMGKAKEAGKLLFSSVANGLDAAKKGFTAIRKGQFFKLFQIKEDFTSRGEQIGEEYVQGMTDVLKSSGDRLANGLPEVTKEQVLKSPFFRAIEAAGDRISGFFLGLRDVYRDFTAGDVLGEMSDFFQGAIKVTASPLERLRNEISILDDQMRNKFLNGDLKGAARSSKELNMLRDKLKEVMTFGDPKKAKKLATPFEKLQEEAKKLTEQMQTQFLSGDQIGATETLKKLTEIEDKIKEVQSFAKITDKRKDPFLKAGDIPQMGQLGVQQLDLKINFPGDASEKLKQLNEDLQNAQSPKAITRIQEEIDKLTKQAGMMAQQVPDHFKKMGKGIEQHVSTLKGQFDEFQDRFAEAFSAGAADLVTNIFQGVDHEAIRELNNQLQEQRDILSDQSASNADRDAARERIRLIEIEIKAEKQRGNVLLQTGKLAIETAKDVIKSMLAAAIASAIKGESHKGLLGLITAGIAVAGISALFSQKVPKLAGGGTVFGRNLVEVGEYPDAALNPELIAPAKMMQGYIAESLHEEMNNRDNIAAERSGGQRASQAYQDPVSLYQPAQDIVVSGHIETRVDGDDLIQVFIPAAERYERRTGQKIIG